MSEDAQRPIVTALGLYSREQEPHRLDVVTEHLDRQCRHRFDRLPMSLEIWHKQLDPNRGKQPLEVPRNPAEMSRSPVRQIVPGHRGEHRIAYPVVLDVFGDLLSLPYIRCSRRSVLHGTEAKSAFTALTAFCHR